jgi:septum site-determining protein MinC
VVQTAVRERQSMRFIGRSYMAYVLTPEAPVADWLADLDAWLARSPGFFAGRAIVLDLSGVALNAAGIAHLSLSLEMRDIRILALEGIDPALVGRELPPVLVGNQKSGTVELKPPADGERAPAAVPKKSSSLLVETSVRSGQSVVFADGDVTVLGSVGSGAEVVAGGSIHIYGTLRGRAMAGATGNPRARIFCHKIEAELLAIDGFYRTADEIDVTLRNRPTQAWLDGGNMMIAALS